jgi:uncharacterized protein YdeI (BOF family)
MEKPASEKIRSFTIIFLAALAAILSTPTKIHAQQGLAIITEVFYDAEGPDSEYEWIELKNISTMEQNIGGWKIQIAGTTWATVYTFPSFLWQPGEIITIGESQTDADIITNLGMQNGGSATDGIRIVDFGQRPIDTVLYDEPNENGLTDDQSLIPDTYAPDVTEGHSLCRITDEDTDSMDDFIECENPTFGEENLFYPSAIIEGPDEADVEEEITFSGSSSSDIDGEIIEYLWSIEELNYEKYGEETILLFSEEGKYNLKLTVQDDSGLTASSTKVITVNKGESQHDITKTTIETIKNLEDGQEVMCEGIITASADMLYSTDGYIQDETGGIRIKIPDDITLEFGKSYRITGVRSTTYNEPRINISTAEKIDLGIEIVPMHIKTISELKNHIGDLVKLTGLVVKKSGNNFYIESDDPENPFRITVSKYNNIEISSDIKNTEVMVIGIASRYGTDEDGNPKIKIMPRSSKDINLTLSGEVLAVTGSNIDIILILSIIAIPIALFYIQYSLKNPSF